MGVVKGCGKCMDAVNTVSFCFVLFFAHIKHWPEVHCAAYFWKCCVASFKKSCACACAVTRFKTDGRRDWFFFKEVPSDANI